MDRERFARQLTDLGIRAGDSLYVRASLGAVGKVSGDLYDTVIGGFLDALGPDGTLIAPAFRTVGNLLRRERVKIDATTPPNSGALSKLLLRHPDAVRSTHPSHSFVAVGPAARELLRGHDGDAASFLPVRKLADRDGKMLLLGCSRASPGFSTVHVTQFELGLSQGHLFRHFLRAWVGDENGWSPWKPIESPGCSASFDKFYGPYIQDENLVTGRIGDAYCLLVPSARRALATERSILERDPGFVDCGRSDCLTCGFRSYQWWRIPRTVVVAAFKLLARRLKRSA